MLALEGALTQLRNASFEFLWPSTCIVCGREGALLCDGCRQELNWIDQAYACPSCGAPFGWLCCTECKKNWEFEDCSCAFVLDSFSGRFCVSYKDFCELRLAPLMAELMCESLRAKEELWAHSELLSLDGLCFIPASAAAYRRRGFDHMELVAQELARLLEIPVLDVLARSSTKDQRALGRQERERNMENSFVCLEDIAGLKLLLIDDVITTGASIRAAARTLKRRGAHSVYAAAFARTW